MYIILNLEIKRILSICSSVRLHDDDDDDDDDDDNDDKNNV
jgi:hypothetical protein